MSLLTKIRDAIASARDSMRAAAWLYAIGGPVGMLHTLKIARLKRRVRNVGTYIDREKELHREHLRALHYELTELVREQQETSVAAAQFWSWCEKKAGMQR